MSGTGKSKERDLDAKLASGAQAHIPSDATLLIDDVTMTVPQIVQRCDDRIAILDKATSARADLKTAVTAEKLGRPAFEQFVAGFKSIILGMYRNNPKTLADFGLVPRKSTKPKVAVKNAAIDKALATRAARHTMGKVQKKDIKGTPPATTTPPATSASAPPPSPAPAPLAAAPAQLVLVPFSAPAVAQPAPIASASAQSAPAQAPAAPAASAGSNGAAPQGAGPAHS